MHTDFTHANYKFYVLALLVGSLTVIYSHLKDLNPQMA